MRRLWRSFGDADAGVLAEPGERWLLLRGEPSALCLAISSSMGMIQRKVDPDCREYTPSRSDWIISLSWLSSQDASSSTYPGQSSQSQRNGDSGLEGGGGHLSNGLDRVDHTVTRGVPAHTVHLGRAKGSRWSASGF